MTSQIGGTTVTLHSDEDTLLSKGIDARKDEGCSLNIEVGADNKYRILGKAIATLLLCLMTLGSYAQTWTPAKTTSTTATTSSKVQCWGTTAKAARCKRMIDPKAPARAVKDAGGVYYCHQHAAQAKK